MFVAVTADTSNEGLQDLMREQNKQHPLLRLTAGQGGSGRSGRVETHFSSSLGGSDGAAGAQPWPRAVQTGLSAGTLHPAAEIIPISADTPWEWDWHPGTDGTCRAVSPPVPNPETPSALSTPCSKGKTPNPATNPRKRGAGINLNRLF